LDQNKSSVSSKGINIKNKQKLFSFWAKPRLAGPLPSPAGRLTPRHLHFPLPTPTIHPRCSKPIHRDLMSVPEHGSSPELAIVHQIVGRCRRLVDSSMSNLLTHPSSKLMDPTHSSPSPPIAGAVRVDFGHRTPLPPLGMPLRHLFCRLTAAPPPR
jgi:hypothetical protein